MATRFVDERGTEWEVWEVGARLPLADAPVPRWSRAGKQREQGWLCFESATQRRRLGRYPRWWEALPSSELAALCSLASLELPEVPVAGGVGTTHAR